MTSSIRNRLILTGVLWGLVLAALPAVLAFDRFALSPFLVAAFVCAGLSGAAGAVVAGRRAMDLVRGRRGLLAVSGIGAVQGLVSGVLAAFSIWLALSVTISGFSVGGGNTCVSLRNQFPQSSRICRSVRGLRSNREFDQVFFSNDFADIFFRI